MTSRSESSRAFLDANVLIAAALGGGCVKLWQLASVVLVTSEYAAEEARFNLLRIGGNQAVEALVDLLQRVEVHTRDFSSPLYANWKLKDEKDIPILVGAIETNCGYLLTADSDCFGEYYGKAIDGVTILKPGIFLKLQGK